MIINIVKKQALIFLRNRHQLFLLILLPIILIAILGISLSGFFNSSSMPIDAKVALIEHEAEDEQVERFLKELETSRLPEQAKSEIRNSVQQLKPVTILKEDVFGSIEHIVELESVPLKNRDTVLNDKTYTAVIEIPKHFSYSIYSSLFLKEIAAETLTVYENEEEQQAASIVKSIVKQYQDNLTLINVAAHHDLNIEQLHSLSAGASGEITVIERVKPINSKLYYTVGMAVMNVLFIASAIGTFAYKEKKDHVFDRIMLSNISRWTYFTGIFISGTVFALVQLFIIFLVSRILFNVTWENLGGFFLVTLVLSLAVGGISVLLTTINYRLSSEIATNLFQTIIISIFAFLGGSFFPIGDLSEYIQFIGNFTPNGASLSAYLGMLRGNEIATIMNYIFYLLGFTFVLLIIAIISFPKRSRSS